MANGKRITAGGIGLAVANLFFALLVFQFGIPIHEQVVASGTGVIMILTNALVAKFFK